MKEEVGLTVRKADSRNGNLASQTTVSSDGRSSSSEGLMAGKPSSDSLVLKEYTNHINNTSALNQNQNTREFKVSSGGGGGEMNEGRSIGCLELRNRLASNLKKVRVDIRYLNHVIKDLNAYLDKLSRNLAEITETILERAKSLPGQVEVYATSLLQDIGDEHATETQRITDKINEFDIYMKGSKDLVMEAEDVLRGGDDVIERRAIGLITRLLESGQNIPVCPTERCIYVLAPCVQHGAKEDEVPLEARLGVFDKVCVPWRIEVRRIASFRPDQVSARVITSICPVSEEEAWVIWTWGPQIHLVDKDGQVKRSIDVGCKVDDICVDFDGNLIVSCHEKRCIKLLDSNYEVKKTIQVEKVPRGVRCASPSEMVVCAVENLHHRNGDASGILHVGPESNQIATDITGQQDLLQPWRIAVNCNGDICVSDRNKGCVSIFDRAGKLKTSYSGPDMSTRHAFAPHGICCDRYGQIFVVDYTNHTVHVLDPLGRFRGFLIMDTELEKLAIFMGTSSPFSIGIDKAGDLWVGNKYGFVTVLRYLM